MSEDKSTYYYEYIHGFLELLLLWLFCLFFSYPTFDVYVVEGIPGTYLVNRRVYGSSQGATVISFDKGGEWQPVTPPAVDANGNFITCNLVSIYCTPFLLPLSLSPSLSMHVVVLVLSLFLAMFTSSSHVR